MAGFEPTLVSPRQNRTYQSRPPFPFQKGLLSEPHPILLDQVGPKINVAFFDAENNRMIQTHPLNKRSQKSKERRFCKSIIKRGLAQSARGDPIMVFSEGRAGPLLAIPL